MATNLTTVANSNFGIMDVTAIDNVTESPENVSDVTSNGSTPRFPGFERRLFSPPPLQDIHYVEITFYSIIFVLAIVGNALVITTVIQNKRMGTVTNAFLLNLAVSDLLLAVFCMPFTFIPVLLRNFIFGPTVCVLIRYLQGVSVSVSCFTLVTISMERYFAICRPLHSRKWQTLSHAYKAIAVCWLLAFCLCVPMAVYTKYGPLPRGNYKCAEVWPTPHAHKAYTIILDVVLLALPVVIMSISYGMIAITLWQGMKLDKQETDEQNGICVHRESRSSTSTDGFGRLISPSESCASSKRGKEKRRFDYARGMRQSNSEKSRKAKKRVIKMLFAVVLEFFFCWTPIFVLQTWITVDYKDAAKRLAPTPGILTGCFLLSYVSSCCNPITYCFMNKNFRKGFLSVCRCCITKVRARSSDPPSYNSYNFVSTSTVRTGTSRLSSNYDKVESE